MASKLVAFRLPDDVVQAIESESRSTGKDKTAVVVQALRHFFELPSALESTRVDGLQRQMNELQQKVEKLAEQLNQTTLSQLK
ncbi:MAG: class 1 isoprenoid biosynthesis enzyme [Leptolyngbyaceae cyanobacterium SM1_4_3]|jgi:predicted transcriptional regulator|nr:class 1 isoprenoid biosynthesis enzyme [Leptolyngbyaceae cyanobacterium SM1_4_3]NJN89992.1 class 1 isoprenoid biosynthesis enzyme [Leptolyngbyaceae cyanobacterium SL_5_14]